MHEAATWGLPDFVFARCTFINTWRMDRECRPGGHRFVSGYREALALLNDLQALLENKKVPFLLVIAFCAIAMQRGSFDLREYVYYWRILGALQNGEKGKYVRNIYLRRGITKQVCK
jgi:hypothetical protein